MPSSPSKNKIACTVLAAGLSKRFGSPKQIARLPSGESLVQRALNVANASGSDYTLLVVGANSGDVLAELKIGRAQVILNKDYELGLSTSVRAALESLPQDCVGVIFMVADQPNVREEHLDAMIQSFRQNPSIAAVALASHDEPRNPVLFSSSLFKELRNLDGDIGARELLGRHPNEVILISMEDEAPFLDVDRPSDLASASTSSKA